MVRRLLKGELPSIYLRMDKFDFEVYEGKSFTDLCKEVVTRSQTKKDQLDTLFTEIRGLIKDSNAAVMFLPRLKEFMDVGVKNDEQIVKLVAILQRLQSTQIETSGGESLGLSEEEKAELMKTVASTSITQIKKEIDSILPPTSSLSS